MKIQALLLFVGASLLGMGLFSQENPMQFGQIDQSELEMRHYLLDSTASALILGDFGVHKIEYDNIRNRFEYKIYRHVRVKVFKADGFNHGNFKILVYKTPRERNPIEEIKAVSYYLDGNQVVTSELNETDVYIEEIDKWYASVNFSVPDLREGCVFEVEYSYKSYYIDLIPEWRFQWAVPALFSEFHTYYPDLFNYRKEVKGFLPLSMHANSSKKVNAAPRIRYEENHEVFRIDTIPPFQKEPFMDHESNFLSQVEYELASFNATHVHVSEFANNWRQINNILMESDDFGGQLRISKAVFRRLAKEIKDAHDGPKQMMVAAFKKIQDDMTWNEHKSIFPATSLREAWNNKVGNAADINMGLVVLLNEIGIETYPVILRTNDKGKIHPWQTTLAKFNYVIARVVIGDTAYLLDATEKYQPWNLLPERAINGNGRIVTDRIGKADWVSLDQHGVNHYSEQTTILLKSNGGYDALINRRLDNYLAFEERTRIRKAGSIDSYIAKIESEKSGFSVVDMIVSTEKNYDEPLEIRMRIEKAAANEAETEMIYLEPLLFNLYEANPFRLPERLFPVNYTYPRKYSNTIRITMPFGYEIDELPEPIALTMDNRDCFYSYLIKSSGQQIQIQLELEINKAQFSFDEYPFLREFFAMIVEKQLEPLVLRKKTQE